MIRHPNLAILDPVPIWPGLDLVDLADAPVPRPPDYKLVEALPVPFDSPPMTPEQFSAFLERAGKEARIAAMLATVAKQSEPPAVGGKA
jgi:hypothetical protein